MGHLERFLFEFHEDSTAKKIDMCYHWSKGPCTQLVKTLAPKYLYRDYFKAKVYTI